MITVNKAISRGWTFVSIPVFIIMFGTMVLGITLGILEYYPVYFLPISILIAPIIAWFYWSFAITKWRIWAFSNVDDVHELKHQAIFEQLIWEDGSFFEKTEIRTKTERELINELEKRFREPKREKHFVDDPTVSEVTYIYYSKLSLVAEILIMLGCLIVGIYFVVNSLNYIIGIILIFFGTYFSSKNFNKLASFEAQLIIDEKGITIKDGKLSWKEIKNTTVIFETLGKSINCYLIIETYKKTFKVNIDDYKVTVKDLRYKLNIYLGRFQKATTANK